ncbi:MAG: sugar O-acetyltransferase [Methanospirillum sp.]|uniref:sugar O-acetyltransferase n=1 Tax=Methanospirillum sp. TaxID=45200 RepID=UPI00236DED57|nr:sugar O-acetyltransferase [Methanospirillum sp.]MDD1729995.1 sugar O-acetyltransferase [Methanospirillum sp.]
MKHDMSEWNKMIEGVEYDSSDEYLVSVRKRARKIFQRYNRTEEDPKVRRRLLEKLIKQPVDKTVFIEPPFFCDYGVNITFGKNFYANFNCVILDCGRVQIGKNTLLGPGVQIYTATHPVNPSARRSHLESAYPVTIGDNVWIGGGSIILPGVTIGNNSVIGAGSVVTKDIPDDVVAVGNPCRVIRTITPDT